MKPGAIPTHQFPKKIEYDASHAERLAETIIEPCQVPQAFLYALGLSDHWEFPGYRPALRDEQGRGIAFVISMNFYVVYFVSCLTMGFVYPQV